MASGLAPMLEDMDKKEDMLKKASGSFGKSSILFEMGHGLASLSANQVDQLMAACLERGCHNCGIAVAAHANKMSQIIGQLPDFGSRFWNDWVATLIFEDALEPVKDILTHFDSYVFSEHLQDLACSTLDNEGLNLFEMLLDRCSGNEEKILWRVALNVSVDSSSLKLDILLRSRNDTVRNAMSRFTIETAFLPLVMRKEEYKYSFGMAHAEINDCLVMVYEAGLFAAFANSTLSLRARMDVASCAVECRMPDALQFLYNAGVVNNHILHRLKEEEETRDTNSASHLHAQASRQIKEFLSRKASRPRSLLKLCLQETSRLAGWGHARKEIIENLQIPNELKLQLKLTDGQNLLKP